MHTICEVNSGVDIHIHIYTHTHTFMGMHTHTHTHTFMDTQLTVGDQQKSFDGP